MLSMTSDYVGGVGNPEPALRLLTEHSFTHVHWCHQWNTDFLYGRAEIAQIQRWFRQYGLQLTDLHASAGVEKQWLSAREYERLAGVELVKNRIAMTAHLGADAIVLHPDAEPGEPQARAMFWERLRRSLDALEPFARARGVRVALENLWFDTFPTIEQIFALYPPDFVGLCYDSGHGQLTGDGLDWLDRLKGRLVALHLHDNDGTDDQHKPLFTETVDWDRLARLIAASSYQKCVSMEVSKRESGFADTGEFLAAVFASGSRFARMVDHARGGHGGTGASTPAVP